MQQSNSTNNQSAKRACTIPFETDPAYRLGEALYHLSSVLGLDCHTLEPDRSKFGKYRKRISKKTALAYLQKEKAIREQVLGQ